MKKQTPPKLLRPILAELIPLGAFILQWMFRPAIRPYVRSATAKTRKHMTEASEYAEGEA